MGPSATRREGIAPAFELVPESGRAGNQIAAHRCLAVRFDFGPFVDERVAAVEQDGEEPVVGSSVASRVGCQVTPAATSAKIAIVAVDALHAPAQARTPRSRIFLLVIDHEFHLARLAGVYQWLSHRRRLDFDDIHA